MNSDALRKRETDFTLLRNEVGLDKNMEDKATGTEKEWYLSLDQWLVHHDQQSSP